ncbi:probable cytochrome P450 313a2 [Aedes aegypti]|nr:probable cytochrome P450 313a2 [Aedes aegypti]
MIAGNDTSGLAVAYGCLFLAMFPQIQERVYAEIMEHFPSDGMEITADSLRLLEYTERFLKETLRHCPVAANIARENMKDIELDGVMIPAGTKFTVSFWALHRRADMWGPEVHSFDPDHFLPERCRDRNPNAYMPFSTGARNCIGGRYAMLSTKVMLIHILKNFKITTKLRFEDMRYKFGMTLKMSTDHLVQLERRF